MLRQVRGEIPEALALNASDFRERYLGGEGFDWYSFKGKPLNHYLRIPLSNQTNRHCSYCDVRIEGRVSMLEIDHFRPKERSSFPELAFDWDNLFIVCGGCNKAKGTRFEGNPLKPDRAEYEFRNYFWVSETGTIEILDGLSKTDYARANDTMRTLRLNEGGLPEERLEYWNHNRRERRVDRLSYRFMW